MTSSTSSSDPAAMEPAEVSRGAALRRIAVHLAGCGAVLALLTWLASGFREPHALRRAPLLLKAEQPDVVMVGNSILRVGVDEKLVEEETGLRVTKITADGSMSAFWYLVAKNLVARADPPPQAMLVTFRDVYLTCPTLAIAGDNMSSLRAVSAEDEPLVEELAFRPVLGPARSLATKHWPLYRMRSSVRRELERYVRNGIVARFLGLGRGEASAAFWTVLGNRNMDDELLASYQLGGESLDPGAYDFDRCIDRSFLPAMVQVLEERGIQPIFVRMKQRRDAGEGEPSPAQRLYAENLEAWLEGHGAVLLDFTQDPRLTIEHFGAGDHMNAAGRRVFSELLADALRGLVDCRKV